MEIELEKIEVIEAGRRPPLGYMNCVEAQGLVAKLARRLGKVMEGAEVKDNQLYEFLESVNDNYLAQEQRDEMKEEKDGQENTDYLLEVFHDSWKGRETYFSYRALTLAGVKIPLDTVMRGLMTPQEYHHTWERVEEEKKEEEQRKIIRKRLMQGTTGLGLIMIAHSLVKYNMYRIMKER